MGKAHTQGVDAMELHQFMALLHGDELQNWYRLTKFRWDRIRAIRGLMCGFAVEKRPKGKQLQAVVFQGGVSLRGVIAGWRRVILAEKAASPVRRSISHAVVANTESQTSSSSAIGQHLVVQQMPDAKLVEATATVECFHESRVGSAERLVSWFVLFHAMAVPSSKLPVLKFTLGVSESRLRVASTPAPVPNHGGSGEGRWAHITDEDDGLSGDIVDLDAKDDGLKVDRNAKDHDEFYI